MNVNFDLGAFGSRFLSVLVVMGLGISVQAGQMDCSSMHLGGLIQPTALRVTPIPEFTNSSRGDVYNDSSDRLVRTEPVSQEKDLLSKLEDQVSPDRMATLLGETRSLKDFLSDDPNLNLAVQSPMTVMNAAQRMLALIYSQGKQTVRKQFTGEFVDVYPFFSSGTEITNGFRIIGGETAIVEFVNNLIAQAKGDRSGSAIILLAGSHGTGKSEFLKMLALAAQKLTSSGQANYGMYTYAWTGLGDIPSLHRFLMSTEVDGKKTYPDVDAPIGDSPITLFPAEVQKLIVEKSRGAAAKMLNGMEAQPFPHADPQSEFFRNEIIQHYSRIKGRPLNTREIVDVLTKHTIVKRQILDQNQGRMPLIDAQGNDIDVGGLFMSPNPVVRFASGAGPTHVMAWYLNGQILRAHGNILLLDEWMRNKQELKDMTLGAFESRRIQISGSPTVPFDAVIVAATNTANLKENKGESKNEAAVDRFKVTPLRWSVYPNEIAQLMLAQKTTEIRQQKLTEEGDQPVTRMNLDELIPRAQGLDRIQAPDHRYRLFAGEGDTQVEIAPHTIMLMAEIAAATRLQLDPTKAGKEFQGKILGSNLLKNPIDRIRLYEGLKTGVTADEIRELAEVSMLLKEGESGISARHVGLWLTESIQAAANPRMGYTLTPGIALKVLRSMLNREAIASPSTKERLRWLDLADEVAANLLIPRLDQDINRALTQGDRIVHDAYFEILDEMYAVDPIHGNPTAMTYTSSTTGQERPIDRQRLQKVQERYMKLNGQPLNISQIAIFHARQARVGEVGRVPDEALLESVASYFADLNTQVVGFSSMVEYERTQRGSDEVKAAHSSLVQALMTMGYNRRAVSDALLLIHHHRSLTQAAQTQGQ